MRPVYDDGTGTGFQFSGISLLRDYDSDDPAELAEMHGHLHHIVTQHDALIPHKLNRLLHRWDEELQRAIEAKNRQHPGTGQARQ